MRTPKFIRDWFCEDDAGTIWSLVHAAFAAGLVTFLGLSIYHVVINRTFDPQAFGLGLSGVLGGGGLSIFANGKSGTRKDDEHS